MQVASEAYTGRLRMEDAPPVFYGSSQKTDNKAR